MPHTAPARTSRLTVGLFACLLLVTEAPASQQTAGQQTGGAIAFVQVNVVPMDSERVMMRQTVIIEGDRIVAIGPSDSTALPEGTERIEAQGKYLIPGLIDVHSHLLSDDRIADEFVDEELAVIVANGVTTIRNPTGKPEHLLYREQVAAGTLLGPTLYVGSPQLAGRESGHFVNGRVIEAPAAAAAAVSEFDREGYDFIKLTSGIGPDVYDAVVTTARFSRIPVIGHVGPEVGLHRALEAGQQIEHLDGYLEAITREDSRAPGGLSGSGVWEPENWVSLDYIDEGRIEDVVRATIEAETWVTPTLAFLNTAFGTGRTDEEILASADYRFVSPEVRDDLLSARRRFWDNPPSEERRSRYVELRNRVTRELYRAGGKLMAGSNSPEWLLLPGFALHRELESLVEAGLPPYAALWAATRSPASSLSWRGAGRAEFATVRKDAIVFATARTGDVDFGSIAGGRRADLVLLGANPLDDIRNTRRIEGVMLRGRWMPRAELDRLLDDSAAILSQAPLRGGS